MALILALFLFGISIGLFFLAIIGVMRSVSLSQSYGLRLRS
jgi:hypothetical protein